MSNSSFLSAKGDNVFKHQWNVLLASKDSEVASSLLPVLREFEFNGIVVNRGGDVLLTLLDLDFELIIIDAELVGMSGDEIFPIVRRIRPKIPVIFVADNLSLEMGKELAQNGILYRLSKPVNINEVRDIATSFRNKLINTHSKLSYS